MVQTDWEGVRAWVQASERDIDLGGDRNMEVHEYDTRHGPVRLKGPGRVQEPWMIQGPWGKEPAWDGAVAWEET